jgi:F-type H+-transporting ATPase subunit gamma
MQLIATARFQAAFNRATAGKPYTEKLTQLMDNLARAAGGLQHPLMAQNPDAERGALVVLTSNRGLCGGYNANVLRAAGEFLAAAESPVDVSMVGKKGIAYFRFLGSEMVETMTDIADRPRFDQIEPLANRLMARFAAGELATVDVAYTRFVSTARQRAVVERILPLSTHAGEQAAGSEPPAAGLEYEFSPAPQELLEELLPASVRVRIYQCFTDAAVSEQIARMVAMKAATDAAGDMIKRLTMQYNRARQTQITMELLDIVGGANALE